MGQEERNGYGPAEIVVDRAPSREAPAHFHPHPDLRSSQLFTCVPSIRDYISFVDSSCFQVCTEVVSAGSYGGFPVMSTRRGDTIR